MTSKTITKSLPVWLGLLYGLYVASSIAWPAPSDDGKNKNKNNKHVLSQLHLDFEGSLLINDEMVDFAGTVHLVVDVIPPNPIIPGNPISPITVHTNLADVFGIGQDSGAIYRATGATAHAFDTLPADGLAFAALYHVPPNPIYPGEPHVPPNPILPLSFVLGFDDSGAVFFAEVEVGEIGDEDD